MPSFHGTQSGCTRIFGAWGSVDRRGTALIFRLRNFYLGVCGAGIKLFDTFEEIAYVQEGVAIEPDFHECRLHAWQDAGDTSFIYAAYERKLFLTFNVILTKLTFF